MFRKQIDAKIKKIKNKTVGHPSCLWEMLVLSLRFDCQTLLA